MRTLRPGFMNRLPATGFHQPRVDRESPYFFGLDSGGTMPLAR
jgi:hypothetical protein